MTKHIKQFVSHSKLRKILEFPVLFLGAVPAKTPALYSMMNYADLGLGTWYPMGGMYEIVKSFTAIAKSLSVEIHTDQEVLEVGMQGKKIVSLQTKDKNWKSDIIVASADYHHMESLLPESHRSYSERYWKSRTFAPSCLLYYLGLDTKLSKHLHHNLYFDADFEQACTEIYETHQYPKDPLFYLSCTSKTDPSVAPEGYENVFGLIPISTEIANEESVRERYLDTIIKRIYERTGEDISSHIIYKKFFSGSDFRNAYHAYKGNAYGLANTLLQTGPLKPRMRSKKISNLFYTGQLTVPGPGVPPSIISGEVVASYIERNLGK